LLCVLACGGHSNGTNGTITSPNFGTSNYTLNTKCVWTITVPANMSIEMVFVAKDTEPNHDYVDVSCVCFFLCIVRLRYRLFTFVVLLFRSNIFIIVLYTEQKLIIIFYIFLYYCIYNNITNTILLICYSIQIRNAGGWTNSGLRFKHTANYSNRSFIITRVKMSKLRWHPYI